MLPKTEREVRPRSTEFFFESKESSERKWVPGNKNGKKDYKANTKVVDQRNSAKPREKPIENREQRN